VNEVAGGKVPDLKPNSDKIKFRDALARRDVM
jgi:hypothetical protein